MAECAQVVFAQPLLRCGKDAGYFLAAGDHLDVAQLVLRFCNPWYRGLAALQAGDILGVLLGRYQLVVTAAEETQQIVEKLPYIGGPDVVFEMKLVDSLA